MGGKRLGVAAQEAVHASVEEKAQEDVPRIAQDHHEGHERAPGPAHLQVTEVCPVDLRLFT